MATEDNQQSTFDPQPYQFGTNPTEPEYESTGVENVLYERESMEDAPDNPKNVQEVVGRGVVNVANPAGVLTPEEQARKDATIGYDRQIEAINTAMKGLEAPETEEQRKKREKQEKSKRVVGAISDGLRALSNLYFTSRYAPNMYNHEKDSQLNATDARIDKLKAERERNRDQYINYAINLGTAENGRAATLRELEAQQEKMKMAREKRAEEAEAHKWKAALQPDIMREQKGKADRAGALATTAKAEADNAPALQAAMLQTEYAHAGAYRASANASNASAANSRASAAAHNRSNVAEFTAWDANGTPHTFHTKEAADTYAKQHGTYQETETVSTTKKKGGQAGKPSPTGGKKSPTA